MSSRPASEPPSSEITPESLYLRRREFIKNGVLAAGTAAVVGSGLLWLVGNGPPPDAPEEPPPARRPPSRRRRSSGRPGAVGPYTVDEPLTPLKDVTTYNNFYEFGLDKGDPAANAHTLQTAALDDQRRGRGRASRRPSTSTRCCGWFPLEERVYRMRCVEAWSMVIPWLGFPLGDLIKRLEPTGNAKYVEFTTLLRPGADARASARRCWTGRTSRGCAWTRRCTR